jgi:hypothetical protein
MITPSVACAHSDVASHGVQVGHPSREARLSDEAETGWCRACSEYVHRDLGEGAWTLRPKLERGAWLWRAYGRGW